jgi:hypothetical protein
MKLDVLNPQLEGQARPGTRTLELSLRGAWLRELERAQLDGWFRIRVAPDPGMPQPRNSGCPAAAPAGAVSGATAPGIEGSGSAAVVRQGGESGACFVPAQDSADPEPARPGSGAGTSALPRSGAPGMRADACDESAGAPDAADRLTSSTTPSAHWAAPAQGSAAQSAAGETGSMNEAPAENASAGVAAVPKSRQWPLRSVHMMAEGSGARVWIRDSGLTRGSISGILSALTGELSRRGLRLRALSVNGRSAFDAEPAPGSETHRTSAGGGTGGSGKTSRSTFLKR